MQQVHPSGFGDLRMLVSDHLDADVRLSVVVAKTQLNRNHGLPEDDLVARRIELQTRHIAGALFERLAVDA